MGKPKARKAQGAKGSPTIKPLRSYHECNLTDDVFNVYVLAIPSDLGSKAVEVVRAGIPNLKSLETYHLRRFAAPEQLPKHVRALFKTPDSPPVSDHTTTNGTVHTKQNGFDYSYAADQINGSKKTPSLLFMLVCPTSYISLEDLTTLISTHLPCLAPNPEIRAIPVPVNAQLSWERAAVKTASYWPTVYKHTNPFGPHPSFVDRCQAIISPDVPAYMEIAYNCAANVEKQGIGEGIGCVIVDARDWYQIGRPVVAAGDARYIHRASGSKYWDGDACEGNVMGHAVMRAIGMVARKRREAAIRTPPILCSLCETENPDVYYHCDICLDGTYKICEKCYDLGRRCWETPDHDNLVRRTIEKTAENINPSPDESQAERDFFVDYPLPNSPELGPYHKNLLAPGGYLCHNMEIYVTHEPCVMCCMALMHSRFAHVAFHRRMPRTGAITAENKGKDQGLGYGLWWRSELNWKALGWELENAEADQRGADVDQDVHV